TDVQVFYPFHPLHGVTLRILRRPKRGDGAVCVMDAAGRRLKIPIWMLLPECAEITISQRPHLGKQALLSLASLIASQGLLVGLLRCGHCGRKLHVRYWGGRGTNARYLCKGDYDDGGQYCIGFGASSVDRCVGQELLKAIAPLGVEASLRALEELSAGG